MNLPPVLRSQKVIRGLYKYLHHHQSESIRDVVDVLVDYEPEAIRRLANKKRSRGRIDATQFTQAFEQVLTTAGRIAA